MTVSRFALYSLLVVGSAILCAGNALAQSEATMEAQEMRDEAAAAAAGTVSSSSAGSESRASLPKSTWSEIKRNIGVRFFNFSSANMAQANEDGGRLESYNYFSLEYRLSRQERIAIRPAFMLSSGGSNFRGQFEEADFEWADLYINYANNSWRLLPFDMDYVSNIRVYLPTSQDSQTRGMIMRIRPYFIAGAPLTSRMTYAIHFQPDFYIQSRTGFANDRGFATGNRNYGYKVFGELAYRLNRTFSLFGNLGHEQMWNHSVPIERVDVFRQEEVEIGASLGVNWGKLASAIGISQSRNVARPRNDFSLFRDNETQYFARSFYRF